VCTVLPPNDVESRREGGSKEIFERSQASTLACNLAKGKTLSSNTVVENIHTTRGYVKALVALMMSVVPEKGTLLGAKGKFVGVIRSQVGPTGGTKSTKERIDWFGVK
jgi:hypothetical protein